MTSTLFGQIGPYAIERPIGQGGMASVFLARDTRTGASVALKVVHLGADEEAREILESERRGADLQQRFSTVSPYVPKVYESGFTDDYFYIAMEFIAGEDLSQTIHRGPLPWARAVGITMQLCEFLDQADRFEADATSRRVLLHNDLKPRNIRVITPIETGDADAIKVLDFGAAKALSLSRKVTRNDFGSTAYLSPECLESGDRDLHSDAWSLGVLLYEMVRGRQPFRADDTRHLEKRIRSRQPPDRIGGECPPALEAVIAKLLAPYPADRYASPAEIHADLARAKAGADTAALAEGWGSDLGVRPEGLTPGSVTTGSDEPVTRRTEPALDEGVTRPTPRDLRETPEPATRRTEAPQAALTAVDPAPLIVVPTPRRKVPRLIRNIAIVLLLAMGANEGCVASNANDLAGTVPLQNFQGLADLWPQYQALESRSLLGGMGVSHLQRALTSQTMVLAERVMANYRTAQPTVRENQWKEASDGLRRAVALAPGNTNMRAALSYCDGQLHRINGDALKARKEPAKAHEEFTEAIVAFREASELRPGWPDPFLGLARAFIYGLEDVDRGADALAQAEKNGHQPSEREATQLADGYRARGEALLRTGQTLKGTPQERDYLTRANVAFHDALERYMTVSNFGNAAANIRETQKRIDRIEERLKELNRFRGWWPWG
jgi:hypothetical protein